MSIGAVDFLIIGAGPSGLACAIELLRSEIGTVLLIDKGPSLADRACPAFSLGRCQNCRQCVLLSGVGGASGILGGKLCFFPAGGQLAAHVGLSSHGANDHVLSMIEALNPGLQRSLLNWWRVPLHEHQAHNQLLIKNYVSLPLSRRNLNSLFGGMVRRICCTNGNILSNTTAVDILPGVGSNRFFVRLERDGSVSSLGVRNAIIMATGRSGAFLTSLLFRRLGVHATATNVDVGVRLVAPSEAFREIPVRAWDPKLKLPATVADEVRTLCWCKGGQLTHSLHAGTHLVDGHFGDAFGPATSVSIVARMDCPLGIDKMAFAAGQFSALGLNDHLGYESLRSFLGIRNGSQTIGARFSRGIQENARIANLGALMNRSLAEGLKSMLLEIDQLLRGRLSSEKEAYVLAPVVDKYWETPTLDRCLMTSVEGLYVAGDAVGLSRGIVQALFSGMVAAKMLIEKHGHSAIETNRVVAVS